MERALKLVEGGMSPYAAAKAAGVTASGIRRSPQYQAMREAGTVQVFPKGRKADA
jgi:hypothetical protein